MSYVVNTDTVEFYRGRQNHVGGVAVAVRGMATRLAPEDTHIQREPLLGSRTTARAGHRRIGGRNQHHLPSRPRGTFDQLAFRRTDRGIRRFPGHTAVDQELGFEVRDSDRSMVGDHPPRPHTRGVSVLPGRFLVQAGGFTPGPPVTVARGVTSRASAAGHLTLSSCQFGGTTTPVSHVRQVMAGAGGGSGGGHTPVDPHPAFRDGRCFEGAPGDERRIPVTERIPVHTHRYRGGRQFSRPHHRYRHLARQAQATVHLLVTCEPLFGIHRPAEHIKGRSSRVRAEIPVARAPPAHFLTNSYFVATVGGATVENVMSRTRRTHHPDSSPRLKAGIHMGSSR